MDNIEAYNVLLQIQEVLRPLGKFTEAMEVARTVASELVTLEKAKDVLKIEVEALFETRNGLQDEIKKLKSVLSSEEAEIRKKLKADTEAKVKTAWEEISRLAKAESEARNNYSATIKSLEDDLANYKSVYRIERETIDKALSDARGELRQAKEKLAMVGGL